MSLHISIKPGEGRNFAKAGKMFISTMDKCDEKQPIREVEADEKDKFEQIPNIKITKDGSIEDCREVVYVAGKSGSGKSWYANQYAQKYQKVFPHNPIYIISSVDDGAKDMYKQLEDNALKNGEENVIRIPKEEIKDLDPVNFKDCLVIFDDCGQFKKPYLKECSDLRDALLEIGRHKNVYMVCIEHLLFQYKDTRKLLNEATNVVFFPSSCFHHIERYCKQYAGLDKANIDKIRNSKSRWMTIFNSYPVVIMGETECWIP